MNNNFNSLNNKRVFIAPYSSMTKAFKKFLDENYNYEFLGFLDNSKVGKAIYKIDDIKSTEYDLIYIVSPNYAPQIFQGYLKKGVVRKKIKFATFDEGYKETSLFMEFMKNTFKEISLKVQKFLHIYLKKYIENSNIVLFIAPGFVDLNIKELYAYIGENSSYKLVIATNNELQAKKLNKAGFHVISFDSLARVYYSLRAKIKIMDHTPVSQEFMISLINSKTVQIWHGIPLKKIGHLADYKKIEYDIVVSTSNFVTQYSFGDLFKYKKMVNAGYPRNDALVQSNLSDKSLALLDKEIYDYLKNLDKKILVYMPTWRPDSEIKNPIELEKLNLFAKENNIFIVIKTHPFTRKDSFYNSTLDEDSFSYHKNYDQNILFYPTTDDIYPILAFSDGLITDYSSVYFDYLLVNKPMIFFVYDKEYYIKSHGDFMLDFDEYTPGEKAYTIDELENAIVASLQQDTYKENRTLLKDKFFDITDGRSSEALLAAIMRL